MGLPARLRGRLILCFFAALRAPSDLLDFSRRHPDRNFARLVGGNPLQLAVFADSKSR